jgi:predicted O-linked N-acetylglucosamine transferase (SPINDLY family)
VSYEIVDLDAILREIETRPSFLEGTPPTPPADPAPPAAAESRWRQILTDAPLTPIGWRGLAVVLLRQGRAAEAAAAAFVGAELSPGDAGARHLAAVACHLSGATVSAENHCRAALAADPARADSLRNLAGLLYAAQRYPAADAVYRQALAAAPDWAEPWRNKARTALTLKQGDAALRDYRRFIRLEPDYAEAYRNLGNAYLALTDYAEAARWFRRAAALNPQSPEAARSLADVFFLTGRPAEALCCQIRAARLEGASAASAIRLDAARRSRNRRRDDEAAAAPANYALLAAAWNAGLRTPRMAAALGRLAALVGDPTAASDFLTRAPADDPVRRGHELLVVRLAAGDETGAADALDALRRRGGADAMSADLLWRRDDQDEGLGVAEAAWRAWRRERLIDGAAAMRRLAAPADTPIGAWLAGHFAALCGDDDAATTETARWALQPSADGEGMRDFHLLWATGQTLLDAGNEAAARRIFDAYLADPARLAHAYGGLFTMIGHYPARLDAWLDRVFAHTEQLIGQLRDAPDAVDRLQHYMLAASFLGPEDRRYDALCRFAVDLHRARADQQNERSENRTNQRVAGRKIRIGYVITDFLHQDLPPEQYILRYHDRGRFEIFVYFFTPGSLPHARRPGGVPPLLANFDGVTRNFTGLSAAEAAAVVRGDGIDVLVDVVGWWAKEIPELFALRPAPLQVAWLGLGRPGKTGIMDYVVGSEILFPRSFDDRYPEKFIRFPGSYIPPKPLTAPLARTPRSLLGIPDDAFVYLGYHQSMKITGECLASWMEILRRTPDSLLLIGSMPPEDLAAAARRGGVAEERILMLKWVRTEAENIARIGVADLYLDSFPFNSAGLTGFDAIRMNIPRLTLAGDAGLYSRFGRILLGAMGLEELTCRDRQEYIDRAVALYENPALLKDVRARMAAAAVDNPLLESEPLLRKLETAFETIWTRHLNGEPPIGFDLPPD